REIHLAAPPQSDRGILSDQIFAERSQGHRKLDRGTKLRATRQGELLIHHGKDASAGRLDGDHCAVHVAQGLNRYRTNHRVFPADLIAFRDIGSERTHGETLVVATMTTAARTPHLRSAASRQASHALLCALIFAYRL